MKKFFDEGFCLSLLRQARRVARPLETAGPMRLTAVWRKPHDPACLPEVGFEQNPIRPSGVRYLILKPQLVGQEDWRKALRKLAARRQRRAA